MSNNDFVITVLNSLMDLDRANFYIGRNDNKTNGMSFVIRAKNYEYYFDDFSIDVLVEALATIKGSYLADLKREKAI